MFQSLRYSNVFLRLGLAAVFIWFGMDKFINSQYWLSVWMPQGVIDIASKIGIGGLDVIYASGVFELLVGASILSNIFIKAFSLLAVIFLVALFFIFGMSEFIVKDVGLIGGLLSLVFWQNRGRSY